MPETPTNPVVAQLRVLAELHARTASMGYWDSERHGHSYFNHLLACSFPAVTAADRTAEGNIPAEGEFTTRNDMGMSLAGVLAAACWHTGNNYEETLLQAKRQLEDPEFAQLLKTLTVNNLCAVKAQGCEYEGPILHFVEEQLDLLNATVQGDTPQ